MERFIDRSGRIDAFINSPIFDGMVEGYIKIGESATSNLGRERLHRQYLYESRSRQKRSTFREKLSDFFDGLGDAVTNSVDAFGTGIKNVGSGIGNICDGIGTGSYDGGGCDSGGGGDGGGD
jgi:hypothetical protein